jgi:hypothetical protein
MSILKEFEHLTNGDVAEHLAGHRLVQEGQRQKRFENVRLPFGTRLIELVRARLIEVAVASITPPPAPAAPDLLTNDEALAEVAAINTLQDLSDTLKGLLGRAAPAIDVETLRAAIADAQARALAAIEPVKVEVPGPEVRVEVPGPERVVEVPAAGPTDADLVAKFDGISSLEQLEEVLSAEHGESVLMSLVGMADRLRASVVASQAPVEKVAEPAPEVAQEAQAPATDEPAAQ